MNATSNMRKEEICWSIPDDQHLEEWNLGTKEEDKIVKINKRLPQVFKKELAKLFWEYKDVFAWDHSYLKGVDPIVFQHRIPLIPNAKPIQMQWYGMNPN